MHVLALCTVDLVKIENEADDSSHRVAPSLSDRERSKTCIFCKIFCCNMLSTCTKVVELGKLKRTVKKF
jgi:hypothetical protein